LEFFTNTPVFVDLNIYNNTKPFVQQQLSVPLLGVATPAVLRAAPTFAFSVPFLGVATPVEMIN
jgi:hypothetical protein